MDDIDKRLIDLLRTNAREPAASLSRKLGISRSTTQDRIARLERNGTIKSYTLQVDEKVAAGVMRAIVLISTELKRGERAVADLKRITELRSLSSVSGTFDLIATIEADTPAQMDQLLDRIGSIQGITRTMTSIVLSEKLNR